MSEKKYPLIVDIKKDSHEDGPGIRSVVFFKGCPLRCVFCQNIEAQEPKEEISFSDKSCIKCGKCKDICPQKAIDMDLPGRIHRDKCSRCGKCANVCPAGALKVVGTYYPVDVLTKILLRYEPFYRHSGGGVTLSGGECTLYPDYLEQLLRNLKKEEIHVVIETSGYFDYDSFSQKILPYVDFIYYDIKIIDPERHKECTRKLNDIILGNLHRLLKESNVEVHARIPLIPGITTSFENLSGIVEFLREAGAPDVSLLPYNPMGIEMATKLGKPKPLLPESFMKPDDEERIYVMFGELIKEK
jgi:pyruvate formate lyase activating enzyme